MSWTPSKVSWTNFVDGVNPVFIKSVEVSLQGQADKQKEPYKTMDAWYQFNQ